MDLKNVDCSRPIHELSEEVQAQIHQIQYDEQQKLKGNLENLNSIELVLK